MNDEAQDRICLDFSDKERYDPFGSFHRRLIIVRKYDNSRHRDDPCEFKREKSKV